MHMQKCMQPLSVMWFMYSWFGNGFAYMSSLMVVCIEHGSFWQVVAVAWCSSDHFILSSLTSERHSCDLFLRNRRQLGASGLMWPFPVVHVFY